MQTIPTNKSESVSIAVPPQKWAIVFSLARKITPSNPSPRLQISSILPSNRLGLRGSVVKLSLAALPLRTRLDLKTSRALCGLASNDAHHVPVRISSPSRLRPHLDPAYLQLSTELLESVDVAVPPKKGDCFDLNLAKALCQILRFDCR